MHFKTVDVTPQGTSEAMIIRYMVRKIGDVCKVKFWLLERTTINFEKIDLRTIFKFPFCVCNI